jgi:hypothetical protein
LLGPCLDGFGAFSSYQVCRGVFVNILDEFFNPKSIPSPLKFFHSFFKLKYTFTAIFKKAIRGRNKRLLGGCHLQLKTNLCACARSFHHVCEACVVYMAELPEKAGDRARCPELSWDQVAAAAVVLGQSPTWFGLGLIRCAFSDDCACSAQLCPPLAQQLATACPGCLGRMSRMRCGPER